MQWLGANGALIRIGALLLGTAIISPAVATAAQASAHSNAVQRAAPHPPPQQATTLPPLQDVHLTFPDRPLVVQTKGSGISAWLQLLITGLAPVTASLIALWAALSSVKKSNAQSEKNTEQTLAMAQQTADKSINQRANELEIAEIETSLSNFYGPFMQLSAENKRIAELLRARQNDAEFRTLKALLDPTWKNSAGATNLNLVSQVVNNGLLLRTLIREKAGPVSLTLMPFLSRASAHFSILKLAHDGALTERTEGFAEYVYPRELDEVLELERERLIARRDALRSDLSARHAAPPALTLPPKLQNVDQPDPAGTSEVRP